MKITYCIGVTKKWTIKRLVITKFSNAYLYVNRPHYDIQKGS